MAEVQTECKTIGQALRKIRKGQNLSRRSVAVQCGLSTQGIWYLEHNEDSHFQTVRKVCKVLGVSMENVSHLLPPFVPNAAPKTSHVGRPSKKKKAKVKAKRPLAG